MGVQIAVRSDVRHATSSRVMAECMEGPLLAWVAALVGGWSLTGAPKKTHPGAQLDRQGRLTSPS